MPDTRYKVVNSTSVRASLDPESPDYEKWVEFHAGRSYTKWPDHTPVDEFVAAGDWEPSVPRLERQEPDQEPEVTPEPEPEPEPGPEENEPVNAPPVFLAEPFGEPEPEPAPEVTPLPDFLKGPFRSEADFEIAVREFEEPS